MRIPRFLLLTLALAVTPRLAAAQARTQTAARPAWAMITRTTELTWYVDTARIATAGRAATVWLRYDYPRPEILAYDRTRQFSRIEMHERLDCAAGQAVDLKMRLFDATGTRLVAEPSVGIGARTFARHPLGRLLAITCNVLEARRRGGLRQMIETLQRAPVPGRIGRADRDRSASPPA